MAMLSYEVFTLVEIEIIVFWVRHSVGDYERFGGFILLPSSQTWMQYQNCNQLQSYMVSYFRRPQSYNCMFLVVCLAQRHS
jgi:hypothetical protein